MSVYFVSGIDTNVGKSYAVGWLARCCIEEGISVITQKLVQTGNTSLSEDIEMHRAIMGVGLLPEDTDKLTMPAIYSYPCSPHLAAKLESRPIDLDAITDATQKLAQKYDRVLLEGAGGLMVPLTENYLTIDYIKERGYPMFLVTGGELGSINHTLLSLYAIKQYDIPLYGIIYNTFAPTCDVTIATETKRYLQDYIKREFPNTRFMEMPLIDPRFAP